MEHFGQLIRSLRNQARMTQDDLSHATGMSRSAIQFLEGRKTKTKRFRTIERLAKALGVPIETMDLSGSGGDRMPVHIPVRVLTQLEPYAADGGRTIDELATALLSQWLENQQSSKKKLPGGVESAVVMPSRRKAPPAKRGAKGVGGRLSAAHG